MTPVLKLKIRSLNNSRAFSYTAIFYTSKEFTPKLPIVKNILTDFSIKSKVFCKTPQSSNISFLNTFSSLSKQCSAPWRISTQDSTKKDLNAFKISKRKKENSKNSQKEIKHQNWQKKVKKIQMIKIHQMNPVILSQKQQNKKNNKEDRSSERDWDKKSKSTTKLRTPTLTQLKGNPTLTQSKGNPNPPDQLFSQSENYQKEMQKATKTAKWHLNQILKKMSIYPCLKMSPKTQNNQEASIWTISSTCKQVPKSVSEEASEPRPKAKKKNDLLIYAIISKFMSVRWFLLI